MLITVATLWRYSLLFVVALELSAQAIIHSPPRITKQPPADEMFYKVAEPNDDDKPFVIECEAEGEPAPTYRWVKNGKPFELTALSNRILEQPDNGTLVFKIPRDEDLGQYQCFAENEHGTATSNSVFVRKTEFNSFEDEATQTLEAQEGHPFKLQCSPPDGWPSPSVYWLIQKADDGSIKRIENYRMTLDPEGNLWFSNVTRQDASDNFFYVCSATSLFHNEYNLGSRVILNVIPLGNSSSQNRYQPTQQYVSRRNQVALRGKKIELFCIYGGTPLPHIIWSKYGQPIAWSDRIQQGNYGKSLIIKHSAAEDQGLYTCESSNGVGPGQSYSINLEIKAIPYFTEEPEIQNAAEEETVAFYCGANGTPEPSIKWIFNGKPIEQATPNPRRIVGQHIIVIKNLLKSDTGNYGCNATNALGYVYKDVYINVLTLPQLKEIETAPGKEATVDPPQINEDSVETSSLDPVKKYKGTVVTVKGGIHSPPRITKQPPADEMFYQVAQPCKNDKPFVIECEAEGEPAPTYRWVKNGKPFELTTLRNRILEQPDNGTLVFKIPRDEDLGQYQCFAENEHGTATSNSVFVRKTDYNSFKDEVAQRLEAQEGHPFKLQCLPPDIWPIPSVHWLILTVHDSNIKGIDNSHMTLDPEGNLWFSNVTRQDASDNFYYICTPTSLFHNEYNLLIRVILNVIPSGNSSSQNRYQPTRQYVSRRNEVALRGKKIELFCIYGGTPLPHIIWSKNGRPIAWSDRIQQGNYGKSLIIKHSAAEDQGSYTCESSNGVGPGQSYSINLEIKAIPYFTVEPEIQNAAEEETVTFQCEAKGTPEPSIKWIFNGKPIEQATPNPRRIVSQNKIVIKNLLKSDTGNYGCNATNAFGYVYKDVYINVLALPQLKEKALRSVSLIITLVAIAFFLILIIICFCIRKGKSFYQS